MDKSRVDFTEALSDAIELFCTRKAALSGMDRREVKVLRRALTHFASGAVEVAGGKLPKKLPKPRSNPIVPKQKAAAK